MDGVSGASQVSLFSLDAGLVVVAEEVCQAMSDGAVELRDAAEILRKQRPDSITLGDFKHRAANVLKSIVGGDPRFAEIQTLVGQTRSAIQQTELAHLVPPSVQPKARFMNLAATLHWATMMLWLLDTPEATGRVKVKDVRAWLRNNLPKTLTAKRLTTHSEFNATQLGATNTPATT